MESAGVSRVAGIKRDRRPQLLQLLCMEGLDLLLAVRGVSLLPGILLLPGVKLLPVVRL
jgi:hypothetical protein